MKYPTKEALEAAAAEEDFRVLTLFLKEAVMNKEYNVLTHDEWNRGYEWSEALKRQGVTVWDDRELPTRSFDTSCPPAIKDKITQLEQAIHDLAFVGNHPVESRESIRHYAERARIELENSITNVIKGLG